MLLLRKGEDHPAGGQGWTSKRILKRTSIFVLHFLTEYALYTRLKDIWKLQGDLYQARAIQSDPDEELRHGRASREEGVHFPEKVMSLQLNSLRL